jgi:hypothetical protein
MAKLNQIVAVVNGVKTKTAKVMTDVYHDLKKDQLFDGISRTYQPLDEDGETCPPEQKLVQLTTDNAVETVREALTNMFDVIYTQDVANSQAKADVVVDDKVLAPQVPITYLLFLEKQLTDISTFVNSLPVLDPAQEWVFDTNRGFYATKPTSTNKTKKVYRNHVKVEATKEHPAQVEVYTEDVKIGEWATVKFSGAMPATNKKQMLERVTKLQNAVKIAREEANGIEIQNKAIAEALLEYIF